MRKVLEKKSLGTDASTAEVQFKALLEGRPNARMPSELLSEFRDWEREFPDLTVRGTSLEFPRKGMDKRQEVQLMVAQRLVQTQILPEMKRVFERNNNIYERLQPKKPRNKMKLVLPKL